ncbi:MAG: 50S ribosomal protein L17 [Clostridia bacterium]|nr:50S ribosomal protein L17 [Clostridia bacterium]
MARNRKLGKPTDQRLAMLKCLTTDVILRGKIVTTETRAKEVKAIVDSLVALAVKEKDNYETVDVKVITAKLDAKGNKETVKATSKNGKEYLKVVKEEKTVSRQKDMPSRLNARKKMMKMVNKVKDEDGKNVDLPGKLFNEIAPKYTNNVGGYTRIVKVGPRKGDNAPMAILELL